MRPTQRHRLAEALRPLSWRGRGEGQEGAPHPHLTCKSSYTHSIQVLYDAVMWAPLLNPSPLSWVFYGWLRHELWGVGRGEHEPMAGKYQKTRWLQLTAIRASQQSHKAGVSWEPGAGMQSSDLVRHPAPWQSKGGPTDRTTSLHSLQLGSTTQGTLKGTSWHIKGHFHEIHNKVITCARNEADGWNQ